MTSRLFVTLDIPGEILEKLVGLRDEIAESSKYIKWEHDDKLHITIKFLGDVGENITELMERRFDDIIFDKIKCKFSKFSFFVKNGNPRILFADIEKNEEMDKFQQVIEHECELLGFNKERRKFKPHLTLLRIKEHTDLEAIKVFDNQEIKIEPFEIKTFSILKSELKPTGSVYTKVKSFKLI